MALTSVLPRPCQPWISRRAQSFHSQHHPGCSWGLLLWQEVQPSPREPLPHGHGRPEPREPRPQVPGLCFPPERGTAHGQFHVPSNPTKVGKEIIHTFLLNRK